MWGRTSVLFFFILEAIFSQIYIKSYLSSLFYSAAFFIFKFLYILSTSVLFCSIIYLPAHIILLLKLCSMSFYLSDSENLFSLFMCFFLIHLCICLFLFFHLNFGICTLPQKSSKKNFWEYIMLPFPFFAITPYLLQSSFIQIFHFFNKRDSHFW